MFHEHTAAQVQPLLLLLFLAAALIGCATTSRIVPPGIDDYTPPAFGNHIPANEEPPASASGPGSDTPKSDSWTGSHSTEALTLAACLEIALDQNPATVAARHGVVIAEETIGIARSSYYPEIGVTGAWSRYQKRAFLPGGVSELAGSGIIGPTDDWLAGFTARYTLVDGGHRAAEHRREVARKGVAEEEAERVRDDIVFEVRSSFYRLAAATQVRNVAEENLSRAKAHLDLAERLKEAGAAPKADVLRADVEVAEAKLSLVRATGLTRTTRGQLSVAMGLPAASVLEIDTGHDRLSSFALPVPERETDKALHARPEIKAALLRVSADEAGVAAARSAYWPRLHAEAGCGYRGTEFPPEDREWSVALNLSWPIFSGLSRKHEVNRARAELSRQEAEVQQLNLQVQQEVWAACSAIRETWESLQTTETQVTSALESMRVARIRYEVGAATINDLLDAQTALARAETNRTGARWDLLIADAWLDRVRGERDAAGNHDEQASIPN